MTQLLILSQIAQNHAMPGAEFIVFVVIIFMIVAGWWDGAKRK